MVGKENLIYLPDFEVVESTDLSSICPFCMRKMTQSPFLAPYN